MRDGKANLAGDVLELRELGPKLRTENHEKKRKYSDHE
jgi:hypothetical protein